MKKITLLIAFIALLSWQGNAQITTYPYLEDFESGAGGWVADNTTNGSWTLGLPANTIINSAASGANSWVTGLTTPYLINDDSWVTSPIFDFSSLSAPGIQLNVWWNAEFSWDGMVLQSSIDGGTSWQNVGADGDPGNWYTDNTIGGNPGGQQEGWSGRNSTSNGSGAWVSANHDLTGLAGQSSVILRVAFGSDGSVTDEGVAFDDINIFDVNCPSPSALTTANITTTSADLGWTENGTATTWDIEWGTTGFAPTGTPTITGTTTNPHNLTGLTAITTYDFYVRADCGGANGVSSWTGPFTFTTACATVIAPWLDNVEAHAATTNLGLSNCWSATSASAYDWNIDGAGSTPSTGTGPTGANSGVNYFYVEASSGAVGDLAELISPLVDINALTTPALEFYYHMFGSQNGVMGDLYIDIWDGSTWIVVDSIKGEQHAAQADLWLKRTVNLSAFSGTIQVKFRAFKNGAQWGDISLDDIEFKEAPTCFDPSNLIATNITATSADLGWTENGTATTWDIEWGTTGFAPTGTPTIAGTTTNPHNLTGLTAITTYDFYVRADCGAVNGVSSWTGPFSFTTLCASMVAPWLDDIEAHATSTTLTASNCWNATSNSAYDWNIDGAGSTPSSATGPTAAFSGTNYFYIEASSGTAGDTAWLFSPNVDLTALTIPVLEFHYHMFGNSSGEMGDLYVDIWDGSTWTTVDSILGQQQTAQTDPWSKRFINLSAFSGTIQIRFRAISNGTFHGDISLDDIEVKESPSCPDPSALTAINVIGTSADLSWIENGTATSWEIEWGTTGFVQGAGTLVLTSTNPHSLTGLTSVTSYDYYVRAVCGPADSSIWAGPFTFTTTVSCPAPTAQTVTSVTNVTADLGWTENGAATSWEIEWGTTGFVQGTGTNAITTTNPHNLTGLTANTAYDFYVRAVCGSADSSLWTGSSSFTTLCNAMTAPWIDSVELHTPTTNLTNSNCWNATSVSAYDWNIDGVGSTPSTGTGPLGAFSGVNYFYVEASSGAVGDVAELVSPSVDISALAIPSIEFYYHMFGSQNGVMGDLFIDVWDGSTWTVVDSIKGEQQAAQADPWLLKVVDISAFSGTIQVKFRAFKNGAQWGDISLDDIEFKESSVITCAIPTTLTATNATNTSVDLAWTEVGTATTWEIEWDVAGFVQGTGNTVVTTTNPHNLTGLVINTAYDYYVRAICGSADTSAWSNSGNFNTLNVGVNDFSTNFSLNVYPNPNKGVFTLEINSLVSDLEIQIVNLQGQVVYSKNNFDNVSTILEKIDLGDNAKGIYFLSIATDNVVKFHKIVIQ